MDVFEKVTGLDIQGRIGEQRYRLLMGGLCLLAGSLYLPWTAPLYVVTAIKVVHYLQNLKAQGTGF